jgi:tetratricopeptide (TPR) repeat protein
MKMDRGLLIALCAAATSAGCATAGTGGGATAAMPDIACSVQPMQPSPHGAQAQAAINRTLVLQGDAALPYYQQALTAAQEGIEAQPENPWHYILAGQAAAGLGQIQAAAEHLDRAEAMCPEAVEIEILPTRQRAWVTAFERGIEQFRADDAEGAIRSWEDAALIWDGAPNAHFNLAVVHAGRGDRDAALRHYRQAMEIQEGLPPSDDEGIASERLDTRAQIINGMIAVGAQHFTDNQYQPAADVFRSVTELEPNSRDAWYNYSLALYRLERWTDLVPVAERVVDMDPLNYNARIILFNAHRGISDAAQQGTPAEREARNRALATLEAAEALPVRLDDIILGGGGDAPVQVTGTATGTGQAGGPVTVEFTVFGAGGQLGTGSATIQRPARDATAPFTVEIPTTEPVTGWRYRVR